MMHFQSYQPEVTVELSMEMEKKFAFCFLKFELDQMEWAHNVDHFDFRKTDSYWWLPIYRAEI